MIDLYTEDDGNVYSWGRANNGRCGTGPLADGKEASVSIAIPKPISVPSLQLITHAPRNSPLYAMTKSSQLLVVGAILCA